MKEDLELRKQLGIPDHYQFIHAVSDKEIDRGMRKMYWRAFWLNIKGFFIAFLKKNNKDL